VIELAPAQRIEIAENAGGIVIPTPPEVASQRPQPLLRRRDKAIQRARLAHHRRNLSRSFGQHFDFVFQKDARLFRLNHQHSLQHSAIDQRNSEKRLVSILAGLGKIFETRVAVSLLHRDWANLLRD